MERQESIMMSKKRLHEELRMIRDIANQTAQHYRGSKNTKHIQMQLLIHTNEDGTYEFIEQERTVAGYEQSRYMIQQNDPNKTKWDLVIIFLAIYNSF